MDNQDIAIAINKFFQEQPPFSQIYKPLIECEINPDFEPTGINNITINKDSIVQEIENIYSFSGDCTVTYTDARKTLSFPKKGNFGGTVRIENNNDIIKKRSLNVTHVPQISADDLEKLSENVKNHFE